MFTISQYGNDVLFADNNGNKVTEEIIGRRNKDNYCDDPNCRIKTRIHGGRSVSPKAIKKQPRRR